MGYIIVGIVTIIYLCMFIVGYIDIDKLNKKGVGDEKEKTS